jgi:hypothetical protein
MAIATLPLLKRTTCPHCWSSFAPEEVLWITAHADLLGDPRLGPEKQQRFLPTRFDLDGNALDAKGFVCHHLACPKCHLPIPRLLLEIEPYFVSILGSPACGKSFFLTAMTWELRRLLPLHFSLSFTDADPVTNRLVNAYEESLFLNPKADDLVPLANLIRKTETQGGDLYNEVNYGNQAVSYPRPFLFLIQPQDHHPLATSSRRVSRVLCLYDNAGEHFQPSEESTRNQATHHLARSRLLLFLFDPIQDLRFRKLVPNLPSSLGGRDDELTRQESILLEAAARVRRYTGLAQNAKHQQPLVVVVTKYDAWASLLGADLKEPSIRNDRLDVDRIEQRSQGLRSLMLRVCPEIVTAAEGFAEQVIYVPVSALGTGPLPLPGNVFSGAKLDAQKRFLALRPRDIRPVWATVPLLYGLCKGTTGLVPGLRRKQAVEAGAAIQPAAARRPSPR